MVEVHGIKLVYGGGCSHETLGMGDYLAEQGVVLLTPLTGSGTGDFAYRNSVSKAAQVRSVLPVLEALGFRRFALLSNDTPFAQEFRLAYIEFLPSIGGQIVADEVAISGARVSESQKSITSHGWITGSREQMESLVTPDILPPVRASGGGESWGYDLDRIVAAAPDAVIVLPHQSADGWFLLNAVRNAGFGGQAVLNHVIDPDDEIIGYRLYRTLIEGTYVPSLLPQADPGWTVLEFDGDCDSHPYCSAAYGGVLLMAEAMRSCSGGEPGCISGFMAENPDWGSRSFGVVDVAREASRPGDFQVHQVRDGQFLPVDGEQPVAKPSP